ncbi:Hypothetical protein FKW44_012461, partial [Caligus rogercresseyi]
KAEKQKINPNQIENTSKQIMNDSEKAFKLKQIYQEHNVTHRIKQLEIVSRVQTTKKNDYKIKKMTINNTIRSGVSL